MARILLLRHAQDLDNARDVFNGRRNNSLSPLGVKQAEKLAQCLAEKNFGIAIILSSPLKRALETTGILAGVLKIEVEVLPGLIERDHGYLTGKKVSWAKKNFGEEVIPVGESVYCLSPEGGEDFLHLEKRGKQVYEEIRKRFGGKTVMVVTHRDIGEAIISAHTGLGWVEAINRYYLKNADGFVLSDGGVCTKVNS